MIKIQIRILLLSTILLLSACSTMRRPVSQEDVSKINKIGVASTLGSTLHGISIGTTVFNNSSFNAPVPEWQIDKYMVTHAIKDLTRGTRYKSVVALNLDVNANDMWDNNGKSLWDAARAQGLDTVVIFQRGVSDNFPFFIPGYGLFERSFLGTGHRCVYAAYVATVYNVTTHDQMAWQWGGEMPCEKHIDLSMKANFNDYSASEKSLIHQQLEIRLDETLLYSLRKLALIN